MEKKTALVIGAGPAGLTAAFELLRRTEIRPIVLEMTEAIGGISRTVNYRGNRIDIGGHRFFSKSARVMDWWLARFPLQNAPARDDLALGRHPAWPAAPGTQAGAGADPERTDRVMLIRDRLSRILFRRRFFRYPVTLEFQTLANLGLDRTMRIGLSYLLAKLHPIRPERSLEDFFVNRFGRELYRTFFKDYTEKVWGVPCREIKPEWGAQRVKGLSVAKALLHAVRSLLPGKGGGLAQRGVETSLIERFLYPKYGPGQLWEEVAAEVEEMGGELRLRHRVVSLRLAGGGVAEVEARDEATGGTVTFRPDYVLSTMPVRDLIRALGRDVPAEVARIAEGLRYRDFITVGLLLRRMKLRNETDRPTLGGIVPDNWIYIQEPDVKVGRLQIFNNWSPYMVADPGHVWVGLEYFCDEGDELWSRPDGEIAALGARELAEIGVIDPGDVLDATVIRTPKAYPAYFGTYDRFAEIRRFTDGIGNLFLIGRNGMHRYNNADHSMLTAMLAVDNIARGSDDKSSIWEVNTEEEYHETARG